jgi:hypothetical protein
MSVFYKNLILTILPYNAFDKKGMQGSGRKNFTPVALRNR